MRFKPWSFSLTLANPRGVAPETESGTESGLSPAKVEAIDLPVRCATSRASEPFSRTVRSEPPRPVSDAVEGGRSSRSSMSSAGVRPPIVDAPFAKPYETTPMSSPPVA